MNKQYTNRELRILAEAAVDDFMMTTLLTESDHTDISITQRGRGLLGTFLMAASGLIAFIPLVGWILGPILGVLSKLGILEDYVADYLEGKANINKLIEKLEGVVYGIVSRVPAKALAPIASRVKRRVADQQGRTAIDVYVKNRSNTQAEAISLMATLYLTDVIMEMMQKNIKLPKKLAGKTLPKDKSGQGLITINAQNLPSPYNFLHGIQGEIEAEIVDKGDDAWEEASENSSEDWTEEIIDVDPIEDYPQLSDQSMDQRLLPYDSLSDLEDDNDLPPGMEESYEINLNDELAAIKMINEIRFKGK
jgi:hypothetical protein